MPTIVDVARTAGVSVTSVSHVINGTRSVSPEMRERVLAAIEMTGYRANSVARALRRATTESIGLVISEIANPHFTEVIRGVEEAARAHGYSLLLTDADGDPVRERDAIDLLLDRRVDGLIVSLAGGDPSASLAALGRASVPTVLLDRLTASGFDQVGVECERFSAEVVRHLASRGHTRIGMIAGLPGISTTEERVRGYRAGLESSGLTFDDGLIVCGESRSEPAAEALRLLMSRSPQPTAVFVANNLMVIGVMRGLAGLGLTVPNDVALAGFDDFEWSDLFQPRMTTIAQPTHELGREAVRLVLSRIKRPGIEPRTLLLEPTLVHRESCGCPPGTPDPWAGTRGTGIGLVAAARPR